MKFLAAQVLTLLLLSTSCSQVKENTQSVVTLNKDTSTIAVETAAANDRLAIQTLIRNLLNWSQLHNVDLLPAVEKDSIYIGFDSTALKQTIEKLRATNFFSATFIQNYNEIIWTLDSDLRNKKIAQWNIHEPPPFAFANDIDPWCLCQDVPYDKPNPWDLVEVEVLNLSDKKGSLYWKWGKPELNNDPGLKKFRYKFDVEKEQGTWKISYLQGFDYKEATKGLKI